MMRKLLLSAFLAGAALTGATAAVSMDRAEAQSTPQFLDLSWADLLPEGEAERIAQLQQMQAIQNGIDHFGADRMPQVQTFNTVDALDGQIVRLGGYVLPFDFTGSQQISRFLLVPYVGACIHVPPPPPNQLVYVHAEEPIRIQGLWDPVYVKGVMHTDRHDNDLGDTAYTIELTEILPYES